jgi:tetratricopeptide (TPR) repeat protein
MTFAAKLIQEGKYAEAVEEASRAVARDDEDPAALVDRAAAYAWLERYPEAVRDLEAALALDQTAGVLETDVVDDAYFSALLGAARAEARTSIAAAERTLARYEHVLPLCGPAGCGPRPTNSRFVITSRCCPGRWKQW